VAEIAKNKAKVCVLCGGWYPLVTARCPKDGTKLIKPETLTELVVEVKSEDRTIAEILVCGTCGARYPLGTTRCPKDGTSLALPDTLVELVDPRAGERVGPPAGSRLVCVTCNQTYEAGTKRCPRDGTPLVQSKIAAEPTGDLPRTDGQRRRSPFTPTVIGGPDQGESSPDRTRIDDATPVMMLGRQKTEGDHELVVEAAEEPTLDGRMARREAAPISMVPTVTDEYPAPESDPLISAVDSEETKAYEAPGPDHRKAEAESPALTPPASPRRPTTGWTPRRKLGRRPLRRLIPIGLVTVTSLLAFAAVIWLAHVISSGSDAGLEGRGPPSGGQERLGQANRLQIAPPRARDAGWTLDRAPGDTSGSVGAD
jgi:hypothetical protein